jgi:FMN phosphatase YigB (HAD superfamily)
MPHRVLLFDLDDTLISDVASAREAIGRALADLGLPHDPSAVGTVLTSAREVWRANPSRHHAELAEVSSWESLWMDYQAIDLPEAVARTLAGHDRKVWQSALLRLVGDDRLADAAARGFRARRAEAVRPLPGVPERLDVLRRKHVLWLATNGSRSLQRSKLAQSGLAERFAMVFVSAEIGYPKAEPTFAEVVRAQLDAEGRQMCLVVGDSAASDLRLAQAGGWPALHICDVNNCPVVSDSVWHSPDIGGVDTACCCPPI